MRGDDLCWPDPIGTSARFLRAGLVVALQGLGRFHVVCDATSGQAVTRVRKYAQWAGGVTLLVRDPSAVERLVVLSAAERDLLATGGRSPVALRRSAGNRLASALATEDTAVEVSLPRSRLHDLLLGEAQRPLLVTGAPLSDGAIAYWNEGAADGGEPVADVFLVYDRGIETHREAASH